MLIIFIGGGGVIGSGCGDWDDSGDNGGGAGVIRKMDPRGKWTRVSIFYYEIWTPLKDNGPGCN